MLRTNIVRGTACAFVGAGVLMASSPAWATTYQVGPGQAYANLNEVADLLGPGDVVEVQGGVTYTGGLKFENSGTAAQPITIKGVRSGGRRPVISGSTNTVEIYANHYVVEGFEITGGSFRCYFHHGDDITIRDTIVHDCPGHGILGADSESGSLTLEYVEVYACGEGTTRHPIYMATDEETYPGSVFRMQHCYVHDGNGGNSVKTRAERNEIYYNWIEGALYRELELIGPDGQDEDLAREDSDVVGNVFRKTGTFYVSRIGGDGTGQTNGRYRFVGNTFLLSQGSSAAIQVFDGIESVEMHDNVFFRVGGGSVNVLSDGDASWVAGQSVGGSNNWVASGSSVPGQWTGTLEGADPGFKDVGSADVMPTAASPLVDVGVSATSSPPGHEFPSPLALPLFMPPVHALEPVGAALPRSVVGGGVDIGAYEYGTPDPDPTTSGAGGAGASGSASGGTGASAQVGPGGGVDSGSGGGSTSGAAEGGAGFQSAPSSGDPAGAEDNAGCACSAAGSSLDPARASWALAAAGGALAVRRRRRTVSPNP